MSGIMYIQIDLATAPPTTSLCDAENFKEFKTVVVGADHLYVGIGDVVSLAGERGGDAEWRSQLDQMVAYAQTKGWVRDDGAVRAHIEWAV
jgi:hypothetical protein